MKTILPGIIPITLLLFSCAYVPEYIDTGDGTCTGYPASSFKERFIGDQNSSFIRAKAFYTFGSIGSLIAYYKSGKIESIIRFSNGLFKDKQKNSCKR